MRAPREHDGSLGAPPPNAAGIARRAVQKKLPAAPPLFLLHAPSPYPRPQGRGRSTAR